MSLRDDDDDDHDDENLPGLVKQLERDKECERRGNSDVMERSL